MPTMYTWEASGLTSTADPLSSSDVEPSYRAAHRRAPSAPSAIGRMSSRPNPPQLVPAAYRADPSGAAVMADGTSLPAYRSSYRAVHARLPVATSWASVL